MLNCFPEMIFTRLAKFKVSIDEYWPFLCPAGNKPTVPVYLFRQPSFTYHLPNKNALFVLSVIASLLLGFKTGKPGCSTTKSANPKKVDKK